MKAKFNPNSARAVAGLKFQNKVLEELKGFEQLSNVEDTRVYFQRLRPGASCQELSILEKTWGDITFMYNADRYWVECCFAMGDEKTSMCEIKRKNFAGPNKWYCWGKRVEPDTRVFIPSLVWRKYLGRINLIDKNGWQYRTVPIKYIVKNIRAAQLGLKNFTNCL